MLVAAGAGGGRGKRRGGSETSKGHVGGRAARAAAAPEAVGARRGWALRWRRRELHVVRIPGPPRRSGPAMAVTITLKTLQQQTFKIRMELDETVRAGRGREARIAAAGAARADGRTDGQVQPPTPPPPPPSRRAPDPARPGLGPGSRALLRPGPHPRGAPPGPGSNVSAPIPRPAALRPPHRPCGVPALQALAGLGALGWERWAPGDGPPTLKEPQILARVSARGPGLGVRGEPCPIIHRSGVVFAACNACRL